MRDWNKLRRLIFKFQTPKASQKDVESGRSVPIHLWKLFDDLLRRGLDHEELFRTNGDFEEISKLIEILDTQPHIEEVI